MAKQANRGGEKYDQGTSRDSSFGFWEGGAQSQLGNVVRKEPLVSGERGGSEPEKSEDKTSKRHLP